MILTRFERLWDRANPFAAKAKEGAIDDGSAEHLSYVGKAAYGVLREHHSKYHEELWNISNDNRLVGGLLHTPIDAFAPRSTHDLPTELHDEWLPEKLGEIVGRTEEWCDILSLSPPSGKFMTAFQTALANICERKEDPMLDGRIVIRIMFGNVVGMPVDCNDIIKELTKELPKDADQKIRLWVGSWRKGVSWNHAKIIAVDGKFLWTGGHNFRDAHYLQKNPVNDVSLEMEGTVAHDAHRYANAQWNYIERKQSTRWGKFVDRRIPDSWDVPRCARVAVSEWPSGTTAEFPPLYRKKLLRHDMLRKKVQETRDDDEEISNASSLNTGIPVLTIGRQGKILKKHRPSDDALAAMIGSATTIVRFALQDIGPFMLPGTRSPMPGAGWPVQYIDAMAHVLWRKSVTLELVLSNPGSIPANLSPPGAQYGNGWTCDEVAEEIIASIRRQFPEECHEDPDRLVSKIKSHLRICYIRLPNGSTKYSDGSNVGLHAKHFIVDDRCCYVGSQNLYLCDLAEWGVVIDHSESVERMMDEYWHPMWTTSYLDKDLDVDAVMRRLS
mmetsp:Transcript_16980/g.47618  ORF Transcript_16980/g.47618 Transcript_16980/m.47618 type:complete len:556 (-) Transcript_16980:62-1729(-)